MNPLEHSPAAPSREIERRTAGAAAFAFLTSTKLAIALLVAVLACCVVGVTVFRGERAWALVFSTLWFNAMLVLLALSSAAAFFSRIWRRKLTLVSVGMILFHLSFAALLGGVVFNSLFHFRGTLRLTEGETLPNGVLESYDVVELGRLFDVRRLRGETKLLKVHRQYAVDGQNKRSAYEVEIGEGESKTIGTVYVTHHVEHGGVRYFRSKEGYSVLLVLSDNEGRELYGAHIPLQGLKGSDGNLMFVTGTSTAAKSFPFPPPPEAPVAEVLLSYRPNTVKERDGEVGFQVVPLGRHGASAAEQRGLVTLGDSFDAGEFKLWPREIRYWVGMDVRYDPGLNFILGSLCAGLVGVFVIFVGRVRQAARRRVAA